MGWMVNATSRQLYPRERTGTRCIGGWVGFTDGLDRCGKSRTHPDSIPGRPARSESLYRLSHRGWANFVVHQRTATTKLACLSTEI